ncbi:MAG: ribonuclease HI [Thermoplasmata archaeon]
MEAQLPRASTTFSGAVVVYFDGACESARPGRLATYGFTLAGESLSYEERGLAVRPGSPRATNNVAEYVGATRALEWLVGRQYTGPVFLCGDSQLVVRQMKGEYTVKADHLKAYHEHLTRLARTFERVEYVWVPREQNRRADELTKLAIAEARAEAVTRSEARPERLLASTQSDLEIAHDPD